MYIIGYFFLFISTVLSVCNAQSQLLLVQALWTNGQRNPSYVCPKDTNNAADSWTQGYSALSTLGMIEQHQLGEQIHKIYSEDQTFLDGTYNSKQIYFRSSDQPAAIASAYANLIGMYYNRLGQNPDEDYPSNATWPQGFVPAPVHVADPAVDYELNGEANCPAYDAAFVCKNDYSQYCNVSSQATTSLAALNDVCGITVELRDIWKLEEASIAENRLNHTNLFDAATQDKIHNLFLQLENVRHQKPALDSLKGGNLFWRVLQQINTKINCLTTNEDVCNWMNPLKYYAYSTDSVMMRSLLSSPLIDSSLIQRTYQRNDFAALILELYNVSGQYQFQMKFLTDPSKPFDIVTKSVRDCIADLCPLEKLTAAAQAIHSNDTVKDCAATTTLASVEESATGSALKEPEGPAPYVDSNNDTLVFVQAVWRHGDRSPVAGFVCPNDLNKDSSWKQGFDQLSYRGMRMHLEFGGIIYKRYVTDFKHLSEKYLSSEVYIRSTDYNRTIISAISNLIGTFYNKGVKAGVDYPDPAALQRWPSGYVPIPIHTIFRSNDPYADVPYTVCKRKGWLQDIVFKSPEVKLITDTQKELFDVFSKICGQNITLLNVNGPIDTWLVEDNYNKPQLFDVNMFNELKGLDNYAEKLKAGYLEQPILQNMDLSIELPKIRGGPVLWHILENIKDKIKCEQNAADCNPAVASRRYYVYSSHDITLNALFMAMGCMDKIVHAGIPNYSAGTLFELYRSKDNAYYLKILYHRGEYETQLEDITASIPGCPATGKCPLSVLQDRAKTYALPLQDVPAACENLTPPSTFNSTSTPQTTAAGSQTSQPTGSPTTSSAGGQTSQPTGSPTTSSATAIKFSLVMVLIAMLLSRWQ